MSFKENEIRPKDLMELKIPALEHDIKYLQDKIPNFKGKLSGVKGQYLLFQDGTVFNIRTYEGYVVKMSL